MNSSGGQARLPQDRGEGAARRRQAVEAYLAATRTGDFEALLTLLDPEVALRAARPSWSYRPPSMSGSAVGIGLRFQLRRPHPQGLSDVIPIRTETEQVSRRLAQ